MLCIPWHPIYECLNGITIHNGETIFGKLLLEDNIVGAHYLSYSDWFNSIVNYHSFDNMDLIHRFADELIIQYQYPTQQLKTRLESSETIMSIEN